MTKTKNDTALAFSQLKICFEENVRGFCVVRKLRAAEWSIQEAQGSFVFQKGKIEASTIKSSVA